MRGAIAIYLEGMRADGAYFPVADPNEVAELLEVNVPEDLPNP